MGKLKVLIVENEAVVALDIECILNRSGYEVLGIASNFNEGLQFVEDQLPDIILMDIIIDGDKTGIDLAKEINREHKIPVIFLTANSNKHILEEVKASNPYGFINKPFESKDLFSAIEIAHNKFLYEQSIVENKNKLKKLNEELEFRVKERTAELLQKNKDLYEEIKLRNQIEQSLYFSEKLYRDTISNLGSGLAIVDSFGKIISANNSLSHTLVSSNKTLISKAIIEFLDSAIWLEIEVYFKEFPSGLWNKEVLLNTCSGKRIWCRLYVSISFIDENEFNFLLSIIDINQQKINEELLSFERKKLIKSRIEGEERERKRISQELHDGLGQKLTAVKLNMGFMLHSSAQLQNHQELLLESKTMVEEAIQEVREISQNLSPSVLLDYGLESALKKMRSFFTEKKGSLLINLVVELQDKRLPFELETTLYRISQEALNNVLKHSKATQVEIHLRDKKGVLELCIKDDGVGFDPRRTPLGSGLLNMKERSYALKADFKVISDIGKGTSVKVKLKEFSYEGN